ncbi:MAG: hypothetical protein GXO73_06155 [Calditrichaeota bacterium]|nr:hypothetical protein [Calditrichota bacterium]
MTGIVLGLAAMLWVSTTSVAWPWYVLIGTTVTFVTGLVVSHFTRRSQA